MTREELNSIMRSEATRYWLKTALEIIARKDPVDMLHDTELLCEAAKLFAREARTTANGITGCP